MRTHKPNMTDDTFYKKVWKEKNTICEECGRKLWVFNRIFISHVLSKGAYPSYRHDMRNVNILCTEHHQQWEFGNRKSMNKKWNYLH